MSKRKRVSLSVRLQPYADTLLAEVVDWLNSVETDEKNRLIADAIVMAYLPYARASQKVEASEIERCCWETQNMLDKHGFNLRQSLKIPQPQWYSSVGYEGVNNRQEHRSIFTNVQNGRQVELSENEEESIPQSLIEGSSDLNNDCFFTDDEFD